MNVKTLIEKINTESTIDFIKLLEIKTYLPISLKKLIAQEIVYDCIYDDNGILRIDSFENYMSYVRHVITNYTNLEYTDEDYDILASTTYSNTPLINVIMSYFENDLEEFSRILDMIRQDKLQESTLEYILSRLIHDMSGKINNITNIVADKFSNENIQSMIPDDIDLKKLGEFLNNK